MGIERSYVEEINERDINQLILDYRLENNGYTFYYILDSYDLISVCFPFVDYNREIFSEKEDFILDGLLAYNYLLYDYKFKPILPDEYLSEVISFRERIHDEVNSIDNLFKGIYKILREKMNSFIDAPQEDLLDLLQKDIKIILAFLGKSKSQGINRFNQLLSERLLIDQFITGGIDDKYIDELFKNTTPSELTNQIYSHFFDKVRENLLRRSSYEIRKFLISILRDSKVIDRIVSINNSLVKEKKKYIFLYVSSTPLRSPYIFDYLEKNNFLPNINGIKNYSLLRNKHEIYLRFLLDNFSSSRDEKISQLEILLDTSKLANAVSGIETNLTQKLQFQLNSMADITRKQMERNLLIRSLEKAKEENETYSKFKEQMMTEFFVPSSGFKAKDFLEYINQLYRLFQKENIKILSSSSINLHKITYALNYEFSELLNKNNFETISYGKDVITGAFHHFPSLLFYKYKTEKNLFSLIHEISKFYSSPSEKNIESRIEDWSHFIELLSNKLVLENYSSDEISLSKLFLILLTPSASLKIHEEKDKLVYETAKDILSILESIVELGVKSNNENNITHEFYYFLCWVSRRENDFESSLGYAYRGLETFKDSARLLQGAGLAFNSKFYSEFTGEIEEGSTKIKLISESIKLLKRAKANFDSEVKSIKNEVPTYYLLLKNLIAIDNILADLYSKKYLYSKNEKDIEKARDHLILVKTQCRSNDLDYNSYPNYNHTEADIEIQEADFLITNKKDTEKAKMKLNYARERLNFSKKELPNRTILKYINISEKLYMRTYDKIFNPE